MFFEEICWKLYFYPILANLANFKGICTDFKSTTPFPYITLPIGATFPQQPSTPPNFTFPTIFTSATPPPITFAPTQTVTNPPQTFPTLPPTFPTLPPTVPTTLPSFPTLPSSPPTAPPTVTPTTLPSFPTLPSTVPTLPSFPTLTPTTVTLPTLPSNPATLPTPVTLPTLIPPTIPITLSPTATPPTILTLPTPTVTATPCPPVPIVCPTPSVNLPTFPINNNTIPVTPGGIDPRPANGVLRQLPNGCPCIDPRSSALSILLSAFELAENCYTPNNLAGYCISIQNCGYFMTLLQDTGQRKLFSLGLYIKKSLCGYDGVDILVCCPTQYNTISVSSITTVATITTIEQQNFITQIMSPTTSATFVFNTLDTVTSVAVPPPTPRMADSQYCGVSDFTQSRVVGGGPTKLGQYPWIAALGYRSAQVSPVFLCAGTLITLLHVLTSAHCLNDNLYMVRLGEYDISSDQDGAYPIDVPVSLQIKHESYVSNIVLNDIAMLRLSTLITVTSRIRPICLPLQEPLRSRDLTGYQPFVAGWGAVSFQGPISSILQEAQVPIVSLAECQNNYNQYFPDQIFDSRVLCAGGFGDKDTCQGDSGGPLMLPQVNPDGTFFYYVLIGIVSYGFECARVGFPGVYTRVSTFIPWIEQHLND